MTYKLHQVTYNNNNNSSKTHWFSPICPMGENQWVLESFECTVLFFCQLPEHGSAHFRKKYDWSKIIFTTGEIRVTCPDHKFLLQHWRLCHAFSIRFKYVPAFMCTYNRIFIFFSLLGWMSFMVLKYVGMFLATNPVWYPAMETLLKNLLDWLQICRVTYLVIWENQMLCYRCSFLVSYRL